MNFREHLERLGAYDDIVAWVGDRTVEEAVAECERGNWLEWLLWELGLWTMACGQARQAYDEVRDQAELAYDEACAQARWDYIKACAPAARRAYNEARTTARRVRDEACDQVERVYADALRQTIPDLAAQVRAALEVQ